MTIALPDGAAPSEFRIWKSGLNPTRNGYEVLFDDKAAADVMAAFEQHGVDLMLDLEHLSLDQESRSYDPNARGWAQLEVRRDANGGPELWAVNVKWTPDGERRLSERTQRYVSPAFTVDKENRATQIVNIALVAMPATDNIPALVAASSEVSMPAITFAAVLKAAATIKSHSDAELRKLAAQDGGGEVAGVNIADLAAFLGVEIDPGQDPAGFVAAIKAKLQEIDGKLSGAAAPPADAGGDSAGGDMATASEEVAATKIALRLLDSKSMVDGVDRLASWRSIVINHENESKRLASESKALELRERVELVKRLQACGAETPATSGLNGGVLVKRLADEPIEELRTRVKVIEASSPPRAALRAAAVSGVESLSDRELRMCAQAGQDPKEYAARKAAFARKVG